MEDQDIITSMLSNRLFNGIDLTQLKTISHLVKKKHYQVGEFVICQGDLATELFIVDQGAIEIIKRNADNGTEYRIATLIDGDCVGEMTLFDNNPHSSRSASARALAPTIMLVFVIEDLQALVLTQGAQYHKLLINIAQQLSMRLRRTNETALDFLRYRLTEIDVSKLSAGMKPPPLKWADREEIIKEAMFFREINNNAIITSIADDAMLPFYKRDEYVGGKRCELSTLNKLIGCNCIIETNDHIIYVRHLLAGIVPNEFELIATNPNFYPRKINLKISEIKYVAEVIWQRHSGTAFL